MPKTILKVTVGSRAHGLFTPESDYDYRGVFIEPTSKILVAQMHGKKAKATEWIEGGVDDTAYEIGHFLHLSMQSNPTILEVFKGIDPVFTPEGKELRELFHHVWDAKRVRDAFVGYGKNQQKKFLENKDKRAEKYAVAYIRVLLHAIELLRTGTFDSAIKASYGLNESDFNSVSSVEYDYGWNNFLMDVKYKRTSVTNGTIIDIAEGLTDEVETLAQHGPFASKKTNPEPVEAFLLKMRKENWG